MKAEANTNVNETADDAPTEKTSGAVGAAQPEPSMAGETCEAEELV